MWLQMPSRHQAADSSTHAVCSSQPAAVGNSCRCTVSFFTTLHMQLAFSWLVLQREQACQQTYPAI